MTHDKLNLKTW